MAGLTWQGVKWAMCATESGFWHPVTWLSLMVDRELFNNNPGGYHWTNVILHIINTLLLFFILRAATGAPLRSAFVAILFAVHPLHVESVAWVSQRKDLLCTVFGFSSLLAYVKYANSPSWWRYLPVILFFILGLMSKPMIVTFPFVMLLMDFWPLQRIKSRRIEGAAVMPQAHHNFAERSFYILLAEKLPLIVLSAIASFLVVFTEIKVGALTSLEELTIMVRCANAITSYVKYITMMFWPIHLSFFYPYLTTIPLTQVIGSILFIFSITLIIIMTYQSKPYLFVGWFWYLGTLLPVIGIIQVGPHAMADRYTYIPIIGLFIIVVWGIIDLTEKCKYKLIFLWMISLSTVIGLSQCAWLQIGYWRNSITLFEHALKVTDRNYIALNNLGYVYYTFHGDVDKSISCYKEAIKMKPDYGVLYHNLGVSMYYKGDYESAIEYLTKAQKTSFKSDETFRSLGEAYMQMGRDDQAIDAYSNAIRMQSDNIAARFGLAKMLNKVGRNDEAIAQLRKILSYEPDNMNARKKMIEFFLEIRNFNAVIAEGGKALATDPADPVLHKMIGIAYQKKGEIDKSILHLKSSLSVDRKDSSPGIGLQSLVKPVK